MSTQVIALLQPNETADSVICKREILAQRGICLEAVVDPTQSDDVVIQDGVFVVRSMLKAIKICRTGSFQYSDTLIHYNAVEVVKWQRHLC